MVALSNPYKVPSAEDLPMPLTNVDHSNFNWSRFAHTEYLLHPLVSNLSLEAQGAYMRLLAHSARQVPFGSLPADLDVLIGWLGVKFKKGGKDETKLAVLVAEVLNAGFTFCQDKRWYCNLLTDQLPTDENQAIEKAPNKSSNSKKPVDPTLSSKRSEAAAKSHETRRAKKMQSELQNDDAKIANDANLQNQIAKIANDDVLQNLQDAKIANDLQNGGIKGGDLDQDLDLENNKHTQSVCEDFTPDLDCLNGKLKMAGAQPVTQEQLNQTLVTFVPHYETHHLASGQHPHSRRLRHLGDIVGSIACQLLYNASEQVTGNL